MIDTILNFLSQGLLNLSIGQLVVVVLVAVQVTIASVTIYLHRCQAHRGLDISPILTHPMRLWLWLSTGMITKEWVAIHRKHHAKCETEEDPHSPQIDGINKVLWDGVGLYKTEARNLETLERYGHGTPDDWVENHVYSRYRILGVAIMMVIDLMLFGVVGLTVWAIQMAWIPFHAAGVINGLAHYWGYRNYETQDAATNLWPVGFWIGGEELHNNHHAFPSSAKFSCKPWEFDIGWLYIRVLSLFGLVKVKKVAPKPHIQAGKEGIDLDTIRAVILNRLHVMADYSKNVTIPVLKQDVLNVTGCQKTFKRMKSLLVRDDTLMDDNSRKELDEVLSNSNQLKTIYNFRVQLQGVWDRAATSHENLVLALKDWCAQAEATGIKALQDYAHNLKGYVLQGT